MTILMMLDIMIASLIFLLAVKYKEMKKLKNPVSRAIYRKAMHEKSQPNYYAKLLTSQDIPTDSNNLQKQLDTHILTQNPQLSNDGLEEHNLTISDTDDENKGDCKMDVYYEQFVGKNGKMRAKEKVEIERMNIEYENYRLIMKKCMNTIDTLVESLITQIKQLNNKYAEYRRLLQSRSVKRQPALTAHIQSSTDPTSIKQTQAGLQQQISALQNQLLDQLKMRNTFIGKLMQDGYYQANGLVWILEEIIRIRDHDRENGQLFGLACAGSDVKNIYQLPNIELQFKQQQLPGVLDAKSRQYLTNIYTKLQQHKHTQQTKSRELRTRISRRQQSQQKQYIADLQSAITPNSQAKKSPRYQQQQMESNMAYMVAKTHQNILIKSRLSDLARSMEVHTRPEKYNYDIKCIYANTRESLIKWVKGKCKEVVKDKIQQEQPTQSIIIDEQDEENDQEPNNNRMENNSSIFKRKDNTQDSMFVFTNNKNSYVGESKIGSYVNSPISNMSNSRKIKRKTTSHIHRDIKDKGVSLPLISSKAEKRTPNLPNLNKPKIDNNKSKLDSPEKKTRQKIPQVCIDGQNKQKIRILRIYVRQEQDIVLKYLFGTQAKRQIVERLLFQ